MITTDQMRFLPDHVARTLSAGELRAMRRHGIFASISGGDGTGPLPMGVQVDGTEVTVDDLVNPPTRIPLLIRDLVAENEQYWIESVYNVPGLTVQGGAILYQDRFPQDHFLADHGKPAPRAPGAEAPILAVGRRGLKVARPQSQSGIIEVHDEDRRWNRVIQIQNQFRVAANTFALLLQEAGEEALESFVEDSGRFVLDSDVPGSDWANADPVLLNTSTEERPTQEFARVRRLFTEDKAGVLPDTLLVSAEDTEELDRIYGGALDQVLARYGLTLKTSIRLESGVRRYIKSGQVGTIAFDKPLDQEYERIGRRKTDAYIMEVAPVYVTDGADAILEVRPA